VGKIKLIAIVTVLFFIGVSKFDGVIAKKIGEDVHLRESIYSYMKQEKNQEKVFNAAIALNDGRSSNACVYFVSEVLRRNDVDIPKRICNTRQLISVLNERGWIKDKNYKNLKPGDICFTTDGAGNKSGIPTHTYVFMGWVEEGSYDYAYILDNQAKDYDNKIYHVRNIKNVDKVNGFTKDAFSFFMKVS
jgi:hypothetical protein